jgi:hypothetical protein
MRAIAAFIALFAAALGLVAAATPTVWGWLSGFMHVPFHRVGNRLAMVGLAVGLYVVARWLQVNNRRDMGYELPRARFLMELLRGLLLGVVFMLPLAAILLVSGLRALDAPVLSGALLHGVLAALGSGLTVAFIEESFMRGAMQSAITREAGLAIAITVTSLLYAATHFFARFTIEAADVGPGSGVDLVAGSLRAFTQPLQMADAFLCLAAVGVLLSLLRHRTGNIAAGMGLHAGWVLVMLVLLRASHVVPDAPGSWLLSQHDGFVGWLVLAWTVLVSPLLLRAWPSRSTG